MREVELRLQVQLHSLRLQPSSRLPPGVRVTEGGVGHGPGQMGQVGQAGVAFGALGGAAGQVGVGVGVEAVELAAVVATDGLRQHPATQGKVPHAGVAGAVLTTGGHAPIKHHLRQTCRKKVCREGTLLWTHMTPSSVTLKGYSTQKNKKTQQPQNKTLTFTNTWPCRWDYLTKILKIMVLTPSLKVKFLSRVQFTLQKNNISSFFGTIGKSKMS